MRLETIRCRKAALSTDLQSLIPGDISNRVFAQARLIPRESFKRKALRLIAPTVLRVQQARVRQAIACDIPFNVDLLTLGERLAGDASLAALLVRLRAVGVDRVLVPGCYLASEDVQFWLRRKISHLEGIDVYSLEKRWATILPQLRAHFHVAVNFRQASIESLPFEDDSFDLIASAAVLEHVRNLRAMARETARVLRPGGWAWHSIGPLYFSPGGDHCSGSSGLDACYDHLLLDEPDYQARIADQAFYDTLPDPNTPFWARRDQFSFAEPGEYLDAFFPYFDIDHVVVKISEDALRFRSLYPDKWQTLLRAGLGESSLLIKSLAVILRKKTAGAGGGLDSNPERDPARAR